MVLNRKLPALLFIELENSLYGFNKLRSKQELKMFIACIEENNIIR